MTSNDLAQLDLNELKQLQVNIEKEIQGRQKQGVQKAREQILSIAQSVGMSIEDLVSNTGKGPKGQPSKVSAQYRNPSDNEQTWSGRGRQPKWVVQALAGGAKLEDFRI